ncbi:hypothetical protein [Actinokineospora bangkokensis]|uniref:Uncharacterized protein n=1 Tax=Actinokineospora bangkokensis TaxID=1193682 RepID=A0A1Q9LS23_9PSEU|nr:hypothetical protein [Actinokineospora bangkokensis]OLR94801.1 hypothetical protein BJP25_09205 [Actinokineospora bangkokensis]
MHRSSGPLPLEVDRKFVLSGYVYSHSQLLLRSGRTGYDKGEYLAHDSVYDVLFKDVGAVVVSDSYRPLRISVASGEERRAVESVLGRGLDERTLFRLRGAESSGYVLAGAVYWLDDPAGSVEGPSALIT